MENSRFSFGPSAVIENKTKSYWYKANLRMPITTEGNGSTVLEAYFVPKRFRACDECRLTLAAFYVYGFNTLSTLNEYTFLFIHDDEIIIHFCQHQEYTILISLMENTRKIILIFAFAIVYLCLLQLNV